MLAGTPTLELHLQQGPRSVQSGSRQPDPTTRLKPAAITPIRLATSPDCRRYGIDLAAEHLLFGRGLIICHKTGGKHA